MCERTRWVAAAVAAVSAQAAIAADWQCATIGVGAAPAIAEAASGYLERAGEIYPSQLLGVVQSGGRVYLVNAKDDGWSERVRLGLMELRLAEPDITAERRFRATVSGTVPMEIPAGDYACLSRERAARQGLALDARGRMSLAPGKSVHLVDPHEWSVAVEVKSIGSEPLDFREILALSGRSGIYAGLTSRQARSSFAIPVEGTGSVIEVAIGPSGRPGGEVVITPRAVEGEEKAVAVAPAAVPAASPAPVAVAPAMASPVVPEPAVEVAKAWAPVQVAKAEVPAALPAAQPLPPSRSQQTAVAVSEPAAPVVTLPRSIATLPSRAGSAQSYDEYAKMMKSMLALRRSGGVLSVSEMTYVHPAIELLRNLRQ